MEHSEGLAELIERLAVAVFKSCSLRRDVEELAAAAGPTVANLVVSIVGANLQLYRLKDEQAEAIKTHCPSATQLLDLIRRDIELCQARARIRGELNRRLGAEVSSESLKQYGREGP